MIHCHFFSRRTALWARFLLLLLAPMQGGASFNLGALNAELEKKMAAHAQ
jgi:hypothetical protein